MMVDGVLLVHAVVTTLTVFFACSAVYNERTCWTFLMTASFIWFPTTALRIDLPTSWFHLFTFIIGAFGYLYWKNHKPSHEKKRNLLLYLVMGIAVIAYVNSDIPLMYNPSYEPMFGQSFMEITMFIGIFCLAYRYIEGWAFLGVSQLFYLTPEKVESELYVVMWIAICTLGCIRWSNLINIIKEREMNVSEIREED